MALGEQSILGFAARGETKILTVSICRVSFEFYPPKTQQGLLNL